MARGGGYAVIMHEPIEEEKRAGGDGVAVASQQFLVRGGGIRRREVDTWPRRSEGEG
jgi:hypothetical protein